jgi:hypothetical protein
MTYWLRMNVGLRIALRSWRACTADAPLPFKFSN